MTMMIRTDSDGIEHHVWAQRQVSSCAVAALMMAESLATQMTHAAGEWERAKQLYANIFPDNPQGDTGPMTFDPAQHGNDQGTFANMFANAGTFAQQVLGGLRRSGLNVEARSGLGITLIASRVSPTTPVVVLLGRYSSGSRVSGHFVVATRMNSGGQIVYLDPWGGVVNEIANNGTYPNNGRIEVALYVNR